MIAFSPSFDDQSLIAYNDTTRSGFNRLEWTEKEIDNIANYFNGQFYKKSKSSENTFKKLANDKMIIHIASHGLVDYENPYFSRILLGNNVDTGGEDGVLYLHEIYNMDLASELAVLSACNTGAGTVVSGEGVINLSSGFLAAGVNSVMMSLWLVNDRSTSNLMDRFYYQLDQGEAKHQALKKAKLQYLQNANSLQAHPYFWSAFIVNGDMRPVRQSSNWWMWAIVLSIIGIFGAVGYRVNRV